MHLEIASQCYCWKVDSCRPKKKKKLNQIQTKERKIFSHFKLTITSLTILLPPLHLGLLVS